MPDIQTSRLHVHLARPTGPSTLSCVERWQELASIDDVGYHQLVERPDEADVILFPDAHLLSDWCLRAILESELVKKYPDRCFVYDERDRPWCALPGLYASMPRSNFQAQWQRAVPYYRIDEPDVETNQIEQDLLFSFVASSTHRCRLPLFGIDDPRGLVSRADGFVFYDSNSDGFTKRKELFATTISRSKFVLCPRGHGTSSIRLYEVCARGRVPVIISDDWVPPSGPSWADFVLSWPENQTNGLVDFLAAYESEASERGQLAREAYDEWFAPSVAFHQMTSHLARLVEIGGTNFPRRGVRDRHYLATRVRSKVGPAVRRLTSR